MKHWFIFLLVVLLAVPAAAQTGRSKSKKKKKKPRSEITKRPEEVEVTFLDKLWVGGNLTDFSIFNETFRFGITPVASYQINKNIAVGPFVRMAYRSQRVYDFNGTRYKFNTFDVGPGGFFRFDFLDQFFLQMDFEAAFLDRAVTNNGFLIVEDGKVVTETLQQNYLYLGVGYVSGNPKTKFMTSLHYNVLDDFDYIRFPWDFRIGFLFNLGTGAAVSQSQR